MSRLHILAVALLAFVALASGCRETLNVGTVALPTWDNVQSFTVSVTVPGNAQGGGSGNFVVNITGGTGPFEVTYTFSDCVTPRTTTRNITGRSDTLSVTFDDVTSDTNCSLTVNVEDAANRTGSRTRTFVLRPGGGGGGNTAPQLSTTVDNAAGTITVGVIDADGDDVTVVATPPAGLTVDNASQTATGGSGDLVFTFSATDPIAGGSGDVTFAADDGNGGTANATATITIGGATLAADTLYAIPLQSSVAAGDPVTIVVATGVPASPFQYVNGTRVLAPDTSGFTYVDNSFNVGVPGGQAGDVDGIWSDMNPSGFLLAPDSFIQETPVGNQTALDFNVTPLGGNDLTTSEGALFNFQATFSTPGTYQLGFQQFETVDRTYYTDVNTAPARYWGDITNVHAGVNSTVTVTP
jgi:hypothetical protein